MLRNFVQMLQKATEKPGRGWQGQVPCREALKEVTVCGSTDIPRAAVGSPRMLERQGLRSLPRKAAGRNSWPKTAVTFAACTTTGWEGLPEAPGARVLLPRARHTHKRLNR